MLKPNQLFDDRELVFENKWLYYMVFIEFLILASIKLNIKGQHLFYELVKKGGHLLCVSGDESGRKYILGGWGGIDILYGFGEGGCRWVEVYLIEWGCVDIFYGWRG